MTIHEIKARAKACGSHFFDPGAMRFFRSRVASRTHSGPGGVYFVTSEQFQSSTGERAARKFTVRRFDPKTCHVSSVGEFQRYRTASAAHTAAKRAAAGR